MSLLISETPTSLLFYFKGVKEEFNMAKQAKWKQFTKEELINIAQSSDSRKTFMLTLGYEKYCGVTMQNILKQYPILDNIIPYRKHDINKKWLKFSKEELEDFAKNSKTRIEFMNKLGYTTSRPDIYQEIMEKYPDLKINSHIDSFWEKCTEEQLFNYAKEAKNETEFCKLIGYRDRNSLAIKQIKEKYPDIIIQKDKNYCFWRQFSQKELQDISNNSIGMIDFYKKLGYQIEKGKTRGRGKICQDIKKEYPDFIFPKPKNCSYGEQKIQDILEKMNINFLNQYWFKDLRGNNKQPLRFDFYLLDYNILIEFQGEQHYEEIQYFKSNLKENQKRDNQKREYCKKNNIKLIEIPYWDFEIIDEEYIKEKINEYYN